MNLFGCGEYRANQLIRNRSETYGRSCSQDNVDVFCNRIRGSQVNRSANEQINMEVPATSQRDEKRQKCDETKKTSARKRDDGSQ